MRAGPNAPASGRPTQVRRRLGRHARRRRSQTSQRRQGTVDEALGVQGLVDRAMRNAALQRGLAPLDDPAELGALLECADAVVVAP